MMIWYDCIDNFWFVFCYEIEYVLNGDGWGELSVDVVDVDLEGMGDVDLLFVEVKVNKVV